MHRSLILPLTLLAACAATDTDDDAVDTTDTDAAVDTLDGSDTDDEVPVDTDVEASAPTIVSMTPAEDARGVLPDSTIEVRFSVPMDTASVEAALTSVVLGDAMTLTWPDATRLVITPTEGLPVVAFEEGSLGAEVDVGIGQAATSLDGVPMDAPYWASFRVARSYQADLPHEDARTGRVSSAGGTSTSTFQVGDLPDNSVYRAFATFDLAGVPEVLVLKQAVLRVQMNAYTGTPWASLGELEIDPVRFATFDASIYDTAPIGVGAVGTQPADANLVYDADVTTAFEVALDGRAEGGDVAQLRLAFAVPTDYDDAVDYAVFAKDGDSPLLNVDLLVE